MRRFMRRRGRVGRIRMRRRRGFGGRRRRSFGRRRGATRLRIGYRF